MSDLCQSCVRSQTIENFYFAEKGTSRLHLSVSSQSSTASLSLAISEVRSHQSSRRRRVRSATKIVNLHENSKSLLVGQYYVIENCLENFKLRAFVNSREQNRRFEFEPRSSDASRVHLVYRITEARYYSNVAPSSSNSNDSRKSQGVEQVSGLINIEEFRICSVSVDV